MDAGVPIKRPVAGISCGLISDKETGTWRTFTDIQGVEDFHGEMDFKVAGTTEGVTAIQMDLKNDGLTMEIIADALERCRKARLEILNEIMIPCIAKPRDHVSEFAPKMLTMKIDVDKIREVIGKGGSMIQKIVAESGAQVDIDDDGTIHIASPDAASCDAAKKMIDDICFVPEVGKLYYGKVVRILPIGAFVELAPGKDGMIHISELSWDRIKHPSEVVNVGDTVKVYIKGLDREKGKISLGYKRQEDNPWEVLRRDYPVGSVVDATVVGMTTFGAFARIIPGIDGLIHISQVGVKRIEKVEDEINVGDVVRCKVLDVNPEAKRISLSRRDVILEENPEVAEQLAAEKAERERVAAERAAERAAAAEAAKAANEAREAERAERRRQRREENEYDLLPVERATTSLADKFAGFKFDEE